jgi:Flp pilus assembly protein CpaB
MHPYTVQMFPQVMYDGDGFVLPNGRVDVLCMPPGQGASYKEIILQDVLVLAVDQYCLCFPRPEDPTPPCNVILAVTLSQARRLNEAEARGTLRLIVRRGPLDS